MTWLYNNKEFEPPDNCYGFIYLIENKINNRKYIGRKYLTKAGYKKDVTNAYNSEEFKQYAHKTFPGYKYPAIWGENPATPAAASATASTANK